MKNLLVLLGGGILVYIYMCNSKKYNCDCQGDLLNDLTKRINTGLEKAGEGLKEGIEQQDVKPNISSSGSKELAKFEQEGFSDINYLDRGNCLKNFNRGADLSRLYKRYDARKSSTVSPTRVKVIEA